MTERESAITKAKRAAAKKLKGLEEAAREGRKKYSLKPPSETSMRRSEN